MGKENLENLTLTGYNKFKSGRRNLRVTYQNSLCNWVAKQELEGIVRGYDTKNR